MNFIKNHKLKLFLVFFTIIILLFILLNNNNYELLTNNIDNNKKSININKEILNKIIQKKLSEFLLNSKISDTIFSYIKNKSYIKGEKSDNNNSSKSVNINEDIINNVIKRTIGDLFSTINIFLSQMNIGKITMLYIEQYMKMIK